MSRIVQALSLGCLAAIGVTSYHMLAVGDAVGTPKVDAQSLAARGMEEGAGAIVRADGTPDDALLAMARRACTAEAIEAAIATLRAHTASQPQDGTAWRRLADAFLQRVLQQNLLRGMRVGEPTRTDLPVAIAADLDAADSALAHARELGDDSAASHVVEAEILSQRITGIASALQWNGKIAAALAAATARAKDDPRLHIALGLRKLMAPEFLCHDAAGALGHFDFAARNMPDDERPALFAAMASHLQQKRLDAIAWLERAVERNPNNLFAKVVLARVKRGEDDPFGRDVTPAEASAANPK